MGAFDFEVDGEIAEGVGAAWGAAGWFWADVDFVPWARL
jgi:hypothetical protein